MFPSQGSDAAVAPRPLARITYVKIFPPGEPPIECSDPDRILAAGIQNGVVPMVVLLGKDGEQLLYAGIPFHSVARPTGLVAA